MHDANEQPVPNVTVSGSWSSGVSGSESCTTDAMGICTVEKQVRSKISSVEFMVHDLLKIDYVYLPSGNHDLDENSDGTLILILKP